MKFVTLVDLKPGMTLAKNLYGARNELLLVSGTVLTEALIEGIKRVGFGGVYVNEPKRLIREPSSIKIESKKETGSGNNQGVISVKLKENAVDAVKKYFIAITNGDTMMAEFSFFAIKSVLDDIISEISSNRSALVNIADLKVFDEYTYNHSVNVAVLAIMVGVTAKMSRSGLYRLGMGAMLHDIGKIFVPKEVLNKIEPLTADEFEIMKRHSQYGSYYLKKQNSLPAESIFAVLTHHERYDSKGYPLGLPPDKQIIEGKIITVCDNYDAITSDRPYRSAFSPSEAIEHLLGNSGLMFDPEVVELFRKKVVLYPVGTVIKLSNGQKATVVENNPDNIMRPKIRMNPGPAGLGKEKIYDLYNDPELYNVTVIGIDKDL